MLALPDTGVSLQDKSATGDALMRAGAAIHELNCVRKHLSAIKGGRLAAAAAAAITFAISDVHAPMEDDPAVILNEVDAGAGFYPVAPPESGGDNQLAL